MPALKAAALICWLAAKAVFGQSGVELPKPLVPGAKVVTLWPADAPTLERLNEPEVWTPTTGQPDRLQKIVNVNNPSIELHLAPTGKANGVAVILGRLG